MNTPSTATPSAATNKTPVLPDNMSNSERRLERFKSILEKLEKADTKGDGNENRLVLEEMDRDVEGMKKGASPELAAAIAEYEQKKRELAPLQAALDAERKKLSRTRYQLITGKTGDVAASVNELQTLVSNAEYKAAVGRQKTLLALKNTGTLNKNQEADKKALEEKIASEGDLSVLEEVRSALTDLRSELNGVKLEINRAGDENDLQVVEQKIKGGTHTPALTNEIDPDLFDANDFSHLEETVRQVLDLPVVKNLGEIQKELKSLENGSVQTENLESMRKNLVQKRTEVSQAFQSTQAKHAPAKAAKSVNTNEIPEGQQDLVDAGNREIGEVITRFRGVLKPTLDKLKIDHAQLKDAAEGALQAHATARYADHVRVKAIKTPELRKANALETNQQIQDDIDAGTGKAVTLGYRAGDTVPSDLQTPYLEAARAFSNTLNGDEIRGFNFTDGAYLIAGATSLVKGKEKGADERYQGVKKGVEESLQALEGLPKLLLNDFDLAKAYFREYEQALKLLEGRPEEIQAAIDAAVEKLKQVLDEARERKLMEALSKGNPDLNFLQVEQEKANLILEFLTSLNTSSTSALKDQVKVTELAETLGDQSVVAQVEEVLVNIIRKKDAEKMIQNLGFVLVLIGNLGRNLLDTYVTDMKEVLRAERDVDVYSQVVTYKEYQQKKANVDQDVKQPLEGVDTNTPTNTPELARAFMSQDLNGRE